MRVVQKTTRLTWVVMGFMCVLLAPFTLSAEEKANPAEKTEATDSSADQVQRKVGINDTGILFGSTSADDWGCSSSVPEDCNTGRDAAAGSGSLQKTGAGMGGFDFTKLDSEGEPIQDQHGTYSRTGTESTGTRWSCVYDNVTGLSWEVKTQADNDDPSSELHNAEDTYSWYTRQLSGRRKNIGSNSDTEETCYGYEFRRKKTYCNTQSYINRVNEAGLCGYNDWRLPKLDELAGIVHLGQEDGPFIDHRYFPHTKAANYWTSTSYAFINGLSWALNFDGGFDNYSKRDRNQYVRLVRGGVENTTDIESRNTQVCPANFLSNTPDEDFQLYQQDSKYTVHKPTGLMWARCPMGMEWDEENNRCTGAVVLFKWEQAFERVSKLNSEFAATLQKRIEEENKKKKRKRKRKKQQKLEPIFSDWRIPNLKELRSIVEYGCHSPAINTHIFPDTAPSSFWSSSPVNGKADTHAWRIDFRDGHDNNYTKSDYRAVRLVRTFE